MTAQALSAVREAWRQLERARLKLAEAHRRGQPMANTRAEQCERVQRELRMLGKVLAVDVETIHKKGPPECSQRANYRNLNRRFR